jgi:arsenate reductase-like glutaredoxin family protein
MPCRDYYDDHPEAYFKDIKEPALKKQIAFAESALCQTLAALQRATGLTNNVYDAIDFKEAGITKQELVKWHKEHMVLDAAHRAEEKAKKEKAALKKSALKKLTPEERNALGVK